MAPLPLQALIFDVDGTLAETERDGHRVAFNRALAAAGLPWQWPEELYGRLLMIAGGKERLAYYLQWYRPEFRPGDGDLEAWIAALHRSKTAYYQELLASGAIALRPGVRRLITAAQAAGVRLAIATTSALPNALALLEQQLDPAWFEVIAAGDIVPRKKPAPDIYHYVLEALGLPAAACVAIEDSEPGAIAAQGAGLTTVVTVNDYTRAQQFPGAALVLDSLGDSDRPCRRLGGLAPLDPRPTLTLAHLTALIAPGRGASHLGDSPSPSWEEGAKG